MKEEVDGNNIEEFFTDAVRFYSFVEKYTVYGEWKFKNVGSYLLKPQVLPLSNSLIERAFSVVVWLKNRYQNRMSVQMLNAIIRLKVKVFFKYYIFIKE